MPGAIKGTRNSSETPGTGGGAGAPVRTHVPKSHGKRDLLPQLRPRKPLLFPRVSGEAQVCGAAQKI